MTSSGPNSPGTMADDATTGTVAWSNPDNAKVSDNVYATAPMTTEATVYTHYLKATNFGFSIPAGATINGILMEIEEKKTGSGAARDWAIQIVKSDGSIGTTNKALGTNWPTTEAYISYGNSTDLWGETWSDTDINDVDFGIVIQARLIESLGGAGTASVDHIRITVYYTEGGGGGTNMQVNVGDVFRPVSEIHVNVSDVWRPATAYVNVGDVWRA